MIHLLRGELGFPDHPRPGAAVYRAPPGGRLRDIAASLGITERSAHSTVTDLTEADLTEVGYPIRQKDDRRNRYQIQAHLPLPGPGTRVARPAPAREDPHFRSA